MSIELHILLECFEKATRKLLKDDNFLVSDKASERAQVHWLAIYFQDELKTRLTKKRYNRLFKSHNTGYCIDVEYNRVGCDPGESKYLGEICYKCSPEEKQQCRKKPQYNHKDNESAITIDMILHKRGINSIKDNLLCVEVKPLHAKEFTRLCNEKRVRMLCQSWGKDNSKIPNYKYGFALHILNENCFEIIVCENDESVTYKYDV